ncbi:hypothetical protein PAPPERLAPAPP_01140 [Brevundimonas phage vB_BpoS-Papperlapapp]|uniref:Uncharacterized protein n=1 Tax=Brevundimonas phage vB_BpoS-Domovoi TaxID=2948598 RepID=A0A9E7SJJ1_9CAUD|nr:hypothetical protein DOMOVOI_00080 [Brevundimonas phage vB_BpoS-Domovoi]USN15856.1 hypothetical protein PAPPERLAPAPP_01140 [Brevundimonas phage vB_BpoS-Papperlapapp]
MTRIAVAPIRTPENTAFAPGQIVTYAPGYLNGGEGRAEVLGRVENPPFADVPLYRIRMIDALPGCVMPHYGPEGGETAFDPVAAGGVVPNALWHALTAL